ncbi:MAG TPA: DPP IV N-terminal domain-containing protein, partial [Longimicrobiales bacterium]|nr:DPP IV N-terminal domain-containing protein [Longimicrobiales bacterium]
MWGRLGLPKAPPPIDTPRVSPDGKWEALIYNHNVAVRAVGAAERTMLSTDGSEGNAYTHRSIRWAPDSKKLAAYRVKPGYERLIHWIESSPDDQVQPKHYARFYAKPGDELDLQQPVVFNLETRQQFIVDRAQFPDAYALTDLEWRKDSRAVSFEYNQRGHQVYRIIEVNATTGAPRVVLSEEPKTFFTYSGKRYRYDLEDGARVIWMSERDGWNHLYLVDGATGRVQRQITKGEWVVRGVDRVDEQNQQIYFRASGMYAGKDPYFVHYYRINFDGSGLVPFTEADANHQVSWSADRQYYVDLYSRVDQPPVMELRRVSDRTRVAELERADDSALRATGWRYPEVFVAKARDGKIDIWGVIIRPTNFDPSRTYPVIENIYAGPQGSFVPKSFSTQLGMQSIAELGFIVVQVDGMGTNNRSKAFHDVAWQNLGDAGFPDRILWHKAVKAKYAYYDITRVGIYGTSAGGQNSMGALLFHPEFYKVAVSAAGCHDNRMDKIWWNEQWMGKLGPHYAKSSNVDNAWRLQGKLLLVVGELDTNVDPASTFQVANALIKANKMFDLLMIPGAGHTNGGDYGARKRNDFFVHHLIGVEPPDRNVALKASGN